jgi:hypothetical protein
MPLLFLIFNKGLTFSVFTNVTIGMGDDIHKEKASARLLSWGEISVFIIPPAFQTPDRFFGLDSSKLSSILRWLTFT